MGLMFDLLKLKIIIKKNEDLIDIWVDVGRDEEEDLGLFSSIFCFFF